MVGGTLSLTVIVCEAVAELPHTSVAVHVLVTEYLLAQAPGVITSLTVTVTIPVQLSEAVTEVVKGAGTSAAQVKLAGPGTPVMVGGTLSLTVIVCEEVAELPHTSVAVHVLVTEYLLAQAPGVITSLTVTVTIPVQLSEAVTEVVKGAGTSAAQVKLAGPGTPVMVGGTLSLTVIVCEEVAELPHTSVAVHVLVTEYLLAQAPGVITSLTVTVTIPVQLSEAVTEVVKGAGTSAAQVKLAGPGTPVMVGGTLSLTVIVCEAVAELPHTSVAVHVLVTEYLLAQAPGVITSLTVTVTIPVQLSEAVTEVVKGAGTSAAQVKLAGP